MKRGDVTTPSLGEHTGCYTFPLVNKNIKMDFGCVPVEIPDVCWELTTAESGVALTGERLLFLHNS